MVEATVVEVSQRHQKMTEPYVVLSFLVDKAPEWADIIKVVNTNT